MSIFVILHKSEELKADTRFDYLSEFFTFNRLVGKAACAAACDNCFKRGHGRYLQIYHALFIGSDNSENTIFHSLLASVRAH